MSREDNRRTRSLHDVAGEAAGCRRCPLWEHATQTVFGVGRTSAGLMLVGEQPGDREDVQGTPFIGPAGRVLERALRVAGIRRDAVYLTNAVKHFKFQQRGKRRLHMRPTRTEVLACRPWLDEEIALVAPSLIVCLGTTAAQTLVSPNVVVSEVRGRIITREPPAMVTIHPSSVLRQRDHGERIRALDGLVDDLQAAGEWAGVLTTPE